MGALAVPLREVEMQLVVPELHPKVYDPGRTWMVHPGCDKPAALAIVAHGLDLEPFPLESFPVRDT